MHEQVERLYPFARRAGILTVGRAVMLRTKKRLQFILMTEDISANSRKEILRDFADVAIVQLYRSAELVTFFGLQNTKVVGFRKSSLAMNIYRELKAHRITPATLHEPHPQAPEEIPLPEDEQPPDSAPG